MPSRPNFDSAGKCKLWAALGVKGPQDEDVFTQAARAIVAGREAIRIMRCQYVHGNLERVILYPARAGWAVTEWYLKGGGGRVAHKESVVKVTSEEEARGIYRPIFGTLRVAHVRGNFARICEWDNFIVM